MLPDLRMAFRRDAPGFNRPVKRYVRWKVLNSAGRTSVTVLAHPQRDQHIRRLEIDVRALHDAMPVMMANSQDVCKRAPAVPRQHSHCGTLLTVPTGDTRARLMVGNPLGRRSSRASHRSAREVADAQSNATRQSSRTDVAGKIPRPD